MCDIVRTRAVVTGVAGGIGGAVARVLAEDPSVQILGTDLTVKGLAAMSESLAPVAGDRFKTFACNLTEPNAAERLIGACCDAFGGVEALINVAGISTNMRFLEMTDEDWDKMIAINLTSQMRTCRAFGRYAARVPLPAGQLRRIVNVSSVIAVVNGFGQAHYAAAKGGLLAFTRAIALEFAKLGILAVPILPGYVETGMTSDIPAEVVEKRIVPSIPLRRMAKPEEVAKVIAFYALNSSYCTGEPVYVAGGLVSA